MAVRRTPVNEQGKPQVLGSRLLLLATLTGCNPTLRGPAEYVLGVHTLAAFSESKAVPESSGVVASPTNPDVFWTHNDGGQYPPRVYAFRLSSEDRVARRAPDLGFVELTNARNVDWEDIAAGPNASIYILDGGDNPPCERTDKAILRFAEPRIGPADSPLSLRITCEKARFEYPDPADPARPADTSAKRYDAECLMVHPESGYIYVVTKRDSGGHVRARVYKLPAASVQWDSQAIHLLQFVADISGPGVGMVTGGDIAPDGQRMVLRNYWAALVFSLEPGSSFDTIFAGRPVVVRLLWEPQGEGICYGHDGWSLVTTCEAGSLRRNDFPIFTTPAVPADGAFHSN